MGIADSGAALLVATPGLMTTVQDLGRHGYGRFGVPSGGALDEGALRWANLLVGNEPDAAALEVTLLGPTFTIVGAQPLILALTGADCGATLHGQALAPWRSFRAMPGDTIALGGCETGARAYLAIGGGIDVPTALGSRSTDLLSQLGGFEGRALRAGDRVPLRPPSELPPLRAVPPERIPHYGSATTLRVILGPQDDRITADALATFLSATYTLGNESNRMGARLLGPALTFRAGSSGADILSEGIATGAIQVPAQGQPIILLAGHQTTGGYAKIATVIGADLWRLGQTPPGSSVSFRTATIEEAREALREFREGIDPGALVPLTEDAASMIEGQTTNATNDDERDVFMSELAASAGQTDWTPAAVEALFARAAATGVTEFKLSTPAVRLLLQRVGGGTPTVTTTAPTSVEIDSATAPPAPEATNQQDESAITAPVLGIFYRAAKPEEPPLVEPGDRITAGQIVGLIEVMKTFYEVTATVAGYITAALVENGASVQYGQPLFNISAERAG
ncbi:MAG TPA: 5-oxoprolinase/urea amidolyase family protein [Thermomicrobiales bacterium]|jgi:biotin-dependent carboxylase-like uncharacterized protein